MKSSLEKWLSDARSRLTGLGIVAVLLPGLAACHSPASLHGQVLARVNDRDVTTQDLEAEARASGATLTPRTSTLLLSRVIDRQLLAASAHRQGLDTTPNAPSDLYRLQQNWRAQMAVSRLLQELSPLQSKEVHDFIALNPLMFQQRTVYQVESLAVTTSPSLQTTLKSYKDFDLAAAFIGHLGLSAPTTRESVDSASLGRGFAERLAATPDGQLIMSVLPGRMVLSRIVSRESDPLAGDAAFTVARRRLQQQMASSRVAVELRRLKGAARIIYQAGYAPKAALGALS